MTHVRLGKLVKVSTSGLGCSAESARAEEPDTMGDENSAFDDDTDNEETSAERIECVLCHNAHEGEEGSQPVNGEEEKIDADDSP